MIIVKIHRQIDGAITAADNSYLVDYDPRFDPEGNYLLITTDDPAKARQFRTVAGAVDFVMRVSPNRKFDRPGHLNRPIRAFHLSFEKAPPLWQTANPAHSSSLVH